VDPSPQQASSELGGCFAPAWLSWAASQLQSIAFAPPGTGAEWCVGVLVSSLAP